MAGKTKVEIGKRFRKLVVLELSNESPFACRYLCQCDCGKKIVLTAGQLVRRIGSCGCRSKPHKVSDTYKRLKSIWDGMIRRCYDTTHTNYSRYGGRGILVCSEWRVFSNFFNDMSPAYKVGLQLDRKNNDDIYCKSNCRWVTRAINMRNRRRIKLTESDIITIRLSKETTITLGQKYSVDPSQISRIKNNKTWKL